MVPVSGSAINLLMGTAAQESRFGKYLRQLHDGPALGVYQMEPATHHDIWQNYIRYQGQLAERLSHLGYFGPATTDFDEQLVFDLRYATIMARLHYRRVPEALPPRDDVPALASYWKEHYNTHLGKGHTSEFRENYARFLV